MIKAIFIIYLTLIQISIAQPDLAKNDEIDRMRNEYGDEELLYYKYQGDKKYQTTSTFTLPDGADCQTQTSINVVGPIISKQSTTNIYKDEYIDNNTSASNNIPNNITPIPCKQEPRWITKNSCPKCLIIPKKKKKKITQPKPKKPITIPQQPKEIIKHQKSTKIIKKVQKDVIIKKYYIYKEKITNCCRTDCCDCCDDDESPNTQQQSTTQQPTQPQQDVICE
ncbi:hypothetical protein [Candidatus Deianiraea vastatrix]|uniref:Uncharacterized protein n=1 Tax=Candidatus Deianiraea vastatrix TaxID=2163644 RepID=A0A5B8XFG0_9RICK|nr:hypothetical protein [Candidatus Deianiraea vastatrix]QED23706.1 hypothetical protein Deia_00919 [Candidatus Deianiraea vastatrix]